MMMKATVAMSVMAGAASATTSETGANPIRRVVTLMQEMQKEVEAEGEKEEELMKKFMCYCKNTDGSLAKTESDSTAAAEEFSAKVKAESSEKKQVDADLSQSKKDRAEAKSDLAKATKLREKEAKLYAETDADAKANLSATEGAITALEKGMGLSFMQSAAGAKLKDIISKQAESDKFDISDKETIAAFLEGDYAPQSGQIVGILKDMKDNMEKDIGEGLETEKAAIASFEELSAAKNKEIAATTEAIESLTKRSGELAVSIVQNKNAAEDASEEAADAAEFLANLKKNCAAKSAEWDQRQATRAEEVEAISAAIAILNEDDALDLFKKTLKTPEAPKQVQFLQVRATKDSKVQQARAIISAQKTSNQAVALLQHTVANMLKNKSGKVDFSKVLKMIDEMVALLTKEQKDDEDSKKWCEVEFDTSDDNEKSLTSEVKSLDSSIAQIQDEIASLKDAIAALAQKIADLDTTVAEATEQRKSENTEFTTTLQANQLAIELIGKAKNKLMKFYNPDLYVPEEAPKKNLGQELAESFIQLSASQPAAPEVEFSGAKTQKSGSVTALMDKLVRELEVDIQEAEHDEKEAQKDYEELIAESQKTRADDVKSSTDKSKAKADLEVTLEETKRTHSLKTEALAEVKQYIADLHKQCDFILSTFEERRTARTNEVEGLKKAKAVLSGADYSF